jgi:hypothetical protein
MAISKNFKISQEIEFVIGDEATVGAGTSSTYHLLNAIAPPSINIGNVPLDVGSERTGKYFLDHNQSKQRLDNALWEISVQVLATADAMTYSGKGLLGGQVYLSSSAYTQPNLDAGATVANNSSQVILVKGAGYDFATPNNDLLFKGCILKSVEVAHSIDSNGGFPIMTLTWVTAYPVALSNIASAGSPTAHYSEVAQHFVDLDCVNGRWIGETAGSSNYDCRAYGYTLNVSRDIQRVGYDGSNNPLGYLQVGNHSVEGSITIKHDANQLNFDDYLRNNKISGFKVSGTGYDVRLNGKMNDCSVDTGSADMRATYSYTGTGNHRATGAVTVFANGPAGDNSDTWFTSSGHGLGVGQKVTIAGASEGTYNADHIVTHIENDRFATAVNYVAETYNSETWTLHSDSNNIVNIDF